MSLHLHWSGSIQKTRKRLMMSHNDGQPRLPNNTQSDKSTPRTLFAGIIHQLARGFNLIHWAVGITTLPATATSREELSFVLMWLGIIGFMIVVFSVMLYLL